MLISSEKISVFRINAIILLELLITVVWFSSSNVGNKPYWVYSWIMVARLVLVGTTVSGTISFEDGDVGEGCSGGAGNNIAFDDEGHDDEEDDDEEDDDAFEEGDSCGRYVVGNNGGADNIIAFDDEEGHDEEEDDDAFEEDDDAFEEGDSCGCYVGNSGGAGGNNNAFDDEKGNDEEEVVVYGMEDDEVCPLRISITSSKISSHGRRCMRSSRILSSKPS